MVVVDVVVVVVVEDKAVLFSNNLVVSGLEHFSKNQYQVVILNL